MSYDGFISYSHAADDLLAPRLQSGLQRFAKPWWKRRALRVFRDESSLSANPHLWESITAALDTSGWFVLLLSPEAAASEWVNQEIAYWVEHKDPSQILPVVTAGEFGWADGDVSGDAVPDALRGVLSSEPRWVDLRFAKGEESLSLQDPRFADAVADVASAMRGVPKDELAGEEVRQHRRTVRTAWAAGALLLVLAVTSAWAGLLSARNAEEAERQATLAEENAEEADRQATLAEENAEEADRQAMIAEEQAGVAEEKALQAVAESLAANSLAVRTSDPELSVLLALASVRTRTSPTGMNALHASLQSHRTLMTLPISGEGLASAGISPDGAVVAVVDGRDVRFYDRATSRELDSLTVTTLDSAELFAFAAPLFSVDGTQLLVGAWTAGPDEAPSPAAGLYWIDVDSAEVTHFFPVPCVWGVQPAGGREFDPAKPLVVQYSDITEDGTECGQKRKVGVLDPESDELRFVIERGAEDGFPTMSEDGSLLAVGGGGLTIINARSGEVLQEFELFGVSTISPDGKEVLAGYQPLELRSIETGELLRSFPGLYSQAWFSPDGSRVYVTDRPTGTVKIFDKATGALLTELRGHQTRPSDAVMSQDGRFLVSSAFQESPRVWDLTEFRGDLPSLPGQQLGPNFQANMRVGGGLLFYNFEWESSNWFKPNGYAVEDLATGEEVRRQDVMKAAMSPDGRWVVEQPVLSTNATSPSGVEGAVHVGRVRLVDARSGELVATLASCEWFYHFDPAPENDPGCDWPAVERFGDFEFSDDGSLVYGGTWDRAAHVWSTATGDSVWHVEVREPWNYDWGYPMAGGVGFDNSFAFGFSWGDSGQGLNFRKAELADGAETEVMLPQPAHEIVVGSDGLLYMADLVADLVVFDPGTWTEVKRLGRGQGGSLRDVDLSPDGSLAATAGFDGFVRVWDLDADVVVQEMEVSGDIPYGLSDVEFLDETTLLVRAFAKEGIIVFTIDPENLVSTALQSITRGFTSDECATYGLEDCPTSVEAVRKTFGGSR